MSGVENVSEWVDMYSSVAALPLNTFAIINECLKVDILIIATYRTCCRTWHVLVLMHCMQHNFLLLLSLAEVLVAQYLQAGMWAPEAKEVNSHCRRLLQGALLSRRCPQILLCQSLPVGLMGLTNFPRWDF